MASIVTTEGRNWFREKIFNNESDELPYIVAVGDGTASPTASDTSLDNELYRANDDDSNCTIQPTSNTGEFEWKITLSGGTEVPADSDINEAAVITDGTNEFLYREVRASSITLASGDRKTFGGTLTFADG